MKKFKELVQRNRRQPSNNEPEQYQASSRTTERAKTFRARGVPLDWDTAHLQSFLAEQLNSSDFTVLSLAQEVHGRSSTGTVHFPNRPSTQRFTLPLTAGEHTFQETIVLDDNFHGITTLYTPPPEDHKLE